MDERTNEIRVNRALGKSGNFFWIPEQYAYPFAVITLGVWLASASSGGIFPDGGMLFFGIWLTLIITYTVFYGKAPWKLGGGFHEPPNWVLGYLNFDVTKPQFKEQKSTKKQRGYGKKKRKVEPFEKKLQLSCLVEICKGSNQIGAYLLEKNKKYRLVFVFGFAGIRSNLDNESLQAIIEVLQEGLKDLPAGESLVFRCGNFADNSRKVNELTKLRNRTQNKRWRYLLKALKFRFKGLSQKGKFNENTAYIECSYTLDSTAIKGNDFIEQILVGLEEVSDKLTGKKQSKERDKYQTLLEKAYHEGFIVWREFLRSSLGLEYYIYPLTGYEIYLRDYLKYNQVDEDEDKDKKVPEKPPQILRLKNNRLELEINSPYHLTTNIFHVGSPDADKQWVYLPGQKLYVGGVVYHEKPGKWKGAKAQLEAGSSALNHLSTVDTEIVVELTKPNQEKVREKTQERTRDSNSSLNYAQTRKVIDVGANFNIKKSIELEEGFLEGRVAINVAWVGLVYRQSPESLRLALNQFSKKFRQPAVVKREVEYFDNIWLETLPFCWQDLLYEYGRRKQYWTEATVCLLPLNFESTKANKGFCLISDKGSVPLHLDIYTGRPQHTAILGITGSGKSVAMKGMVLMGAAYGLDVTIIDKTRGDGTGTFDASTKFEGGAYFNTVKESNNLFENVNPQEISELEKREAAEKIFRRFLKTGLMSLVIDKNEDKEKIRNYRLVFSRTLAEFFQDEKIRNRYEAAHRYGIGSTKWQDIPTLKHFLEYLRVEHLGEEAPTAIINAAQEIKYQLQVIVESPLGKIISTPSTFETGNKLVVYGIGDVEEEEMTAISLSAYSAAIRKSLRSQRSLFCMDEASNLGSNFDCYGETLRSFCSRGRKEGVSVIYGGQDLDSINALPHSAQIIENTSNFLIGKINSSALDLLDKKLDIPRKIARLNTLDSFDNKNENSTPWLLKTGSTLSFCHYYPSLQELVLIMNEKEFVDLRDEYFNRYKNPYEAIAKLVEKIS